MTRSELEAEYEKIRRATTAAQDRADELEKAANEARRRADRLKAYRVKLCEALSAFEDESDRSAP